MKLLSNKEFEVVKVAFSETGEVPQVFIHGKQIEHISKVSIQWETGDGICNKGKTITTAEYVEYNGNLKKIIAERIKV